MSKNLLIAIPLVLLTGGLIFSQTFAPIGTKWGYDFANPGGGGSQYFESVGDTTIQGKSCQKLATRTVNFICPTCIWTTKGMSLLHENNDSLYTFYGNSFHLLFSYKLNVGDTLTLDNNQKHLVVRKVDTLISGQRLKKWQLRDVCSNTIYGQHWQSFVEKIGAFSGFIGLNYYCFSDPTDIHLCSFSTENVQIGGSCQFTNTKDMTNTVSISISPNPVNDYLSIYVNTQNFLTLKIFDSMGKCQKTAVYTEGGIVDVSQLSKGIYFLQLIDNKGFVIQKKFVKI
ncbi:MAG: T9SS type A sorting domain-containing protein [Saprospiraceae bacterium]|nr:T9SS type A sorting domain-containing protein [Saprospiraceae bacterium]